MIVSVPLMRGANRTRRIEGQDKTEPSGSFLLYNHAVKRSEIVFGAVRIPLDALAVAAAMLLSYRLREANIDLIPWVQLLDPASTLPPIEDYFSGFILPSAVAFVCFCGSLGLYSLQSTRSAWNETGRTVIAGLLWLVGIMAWYFLVQKQLFYSRVLLLHTTFFIVLFAALGRAALTLLQRSFLRQGIGVRAVVSVGRQKLTVSTRTTLERDVRYNYLGHLADLEALQKLEARHDLDLVLQTDPNPDSEDTLLLIDHCRSEHIGYAFLPPVFADVPHLLTVERLGLLPMIRFQPTPLDGWGRVSKRLFDIIASALGIIVLAVPMLIVALCILIDDGRPIFYVSKRVGEEGKKKIPVLKFRSMVRNADAQKADLESLNHRKDGPLFKLKNDPRVTRVGTFLRRWSIDEWPQIFNVLLGHVSLVGPRPHLPEEVKRYSSYQRRVFAVRPGVTGLAQVSGRSDLTFDEEVALDLKYIEEWSIFLDIWILWRTLIVVAGRKGAD
jgi:exopolysaccharide biosynthesis polyprenyl glycosylphosphotransferase